LLIKISGSDGRGTGKGGGAGGILFGVPSLNVKTVENMGWAIAVKSSLM
jgi:hypothetical protein